MSPKTLIWLGIFIGGFVGGYVPTLFGASSLSFSSVLLSGAGSLIGLWLGFKLSRMTD
jgi:predicted MFS family arabinose efflux permease